MRPGCGLKAKKKEEKEEEEEEVVDSIDGPREAWGCAIY